MENESQSGVSNTSSAGSSNSNSAESPPAIDADALIVPTINNPTPVDAGGSIQTPFQPNAFSSKVVNIGFITGLVLSCLCLVCSCFYLIYFLWSANKAVDTVLTNTYSEQSTTDKNNGSQYAPIEKTPQQYVSVRMALAANMYIARVTLISTGIFVGLAFGFLGFSLFLLGINGTMDANMSSSNTLQLQVARISPGVFVLLASTILIGVCITRPLPTSFSEGGNSFGQATETQQFPVDGGTTPQPGDVTTQPGGLYQGSVDNTNSNKTISSNNQNIQPVNANTNANK